MAIVATTDFTGKWAISTPYNTEVNVLQEYIDHYEPLILRQCLGSDLYDSFVTGIGASEAIYTKLRDAFAYDDDGARTDTNRVVVSEGMKVMLQNMIYAHYHKQDLGIPTSIGLINAETEGGNPQNDNKTQLFKYYNDGIRTYNAIQQYIDDNSDDYPDFNGIVKRTSWLV